MKRLLQWSGYVVVIVMIAACSGKKDDKNSQPVFTDVAFKQIYSVKYMAPEGVTLRKVCSDRNGVIQIFSSAGLLKTYAGEFLYPGALVADKTYRPMADKKISGLDAYHDQFVYLEDRAVFANAWAGNLYSRYAMPAASLFAGGEDFAFLITDGTALQYIKDSKVLWQGRSEEKLIDIRYDAARNIFWLLSSKAVAIFSVKDQAVTTIYTGSDLTCLTLTSKGDEVAVGTTNGYLLLNADSKKPGELKKKLPCTDITTVEEINGRLWFGSVQGAFAQRQDGKFDYYASKRWLPSDRVVDLAAGPDSAVLVLTDKGLAKLAYQSMTLQDKAEYFQKQVRARHIRHGFNGTMAYMTDGSLATGSLEDSDNDGLWTSMYLGAEVFRYAVTKSEDALLNMRESIEAMERLYTINGVKGFPSRSFERTGYKYDDQPWRRTKDPEWDWKSTTSSDEAIGHIFVFGAMAELVDDEDLKKRAITLIDSLMQHAVDNHDYLVDWDGKPTRWGRWNPEYVNERPKGVGDRKINSSNYIAMLQTAYYFTKKEVYKEHAFELLTEHGYFENLMRPMSQIGKAKPDADEWSKMLSESWNHSDDEMYFLGYWGLYRYAFNDTLKAHYKEAIIDHWQAERPEKEAAWNIITALTGASDFDLDESVWYLQRHPLDLVHWKVINSQRKDIDTMAYNFREQTLTEVLPPDELPINRHNANRFELDGGDDGRSEYSAGDIWLLPYWMARYQGVISAPQVSRKH
jgi:hypothetical protein